LLLMSQIFTPSHSNTKTDPFSLTPYPANDCIYSQEPYKSTKSLQEIPTEGQIYLQSCTVLNMVMNSRGPNKGWEYTDQLSYYQLRRKGSVHWSCLVITELHIKDSDEAV
jgi:hypothetical protein